jgi:hypothetical protein
MPRDTRVIIAAAVVIVGLAAFARPGPAAGGATPEDLLGRLDLDYVAEVTTHLTTIGSTAKGFRVFGTPQDRETAEYLAGQMRALGLEDVAVEDVKGDGWLFEGASVRLSGQDLDGTLEAASLGGVPGTGREGIGGEVIHVGYGTAPEYEGRDVRGKVVFAWWDFDKRGIWPNLIAEEAMVHGAKAAIIASGPGHIWYQAGNGTALGSNDGECSTTLCVPMVTISKRDADRVMAALARGKVRATVTLLARNLIGATGAQAIGRISGSERPDKAIVFAAHHDAWFTSAADDSVAVGMMLAVAKAAKESGYRPRYTWIFAPVTGEEYGLANAYAEWLQGAWHRVSESHTEWSHDAIAVLNWELHSPPYKLAVNLSHELRSMVGASLVQSQKEGMLGPAALYDVFSWTDGFVYEVKGIPSMTFGASGVDYWQRYHTDDDTLDTLDIPGLQPVLRAETRIALQLDRSMVQYDFASRIASVGASLDDATMRRYGADADGVHAALEALASAASVSAGLSYSDCAFDRTREAVRILEDEITSLHVNEGTVGPHEQVQQDLVNLEATIARLRQGQPVSALTALANVSLNGVAAIESRATFDLELLFRDPAYPKVSWAAEGQFPPLLDLYDVWHRIEAKGSAGRTDFAAEIAELEAHVGPETVVYRARIGQLATTLRHAAAALRSAVTCGT